MQLRMLVQAGVPAALRREVWSLFLDLPPRGKGGVYSHLLCICFGQASVDALGIAHLTPPPSPKTGSSPRSAGASSPRAADRGDLQPADEVR